MESDMKDLKKYAYGYIRVSTEEQVDGASLDNQRQSILRYAASHNIEVAGWYSDEGVSASTTNRDKLQEMLADIRTHRGEIDYVIVYNTSRISRDLMSFSMTIAPALFGSGVALRSTQENIDETPYGRFIQNLSISLHQLDNNVKAETVKDNMKTVAQQGWWQSKAPYGFVSLKVRSGDKGTKVRQSLAPDQTNGKAEKLTAVLNQFSIGNLSVTGLIDYAESIGLRPDNDSERLSFNQMDRILRSSIYCGYICGEKLTDSKMVKAQWDGLITRETYEKNQEILAGNKPTYERKEENDYLYPLKAFLVCSNCKNKIRGSAPTNGSGKRSPRYHCSECRAMSSVNVETMHERFHELLQTITPTEEGIKLFKAVIRNTAQKKLAEVNTELKTARTKLASVDKDVQKALQKLVEDKISQESYDVYEAGKKKERAGYNKEVQKLEKVQRINEGTIEYVCSFMTRPAKLWRDADYEARMLFQKIVFPEGLEWDCENARFGTGKLSILYRLAAIKKDPEESSDLHLVHPTRFERVTSCSASKRSIQLSYGCIHIIGPKTADVYTQSHAEAR